MSSSSSTKGTRKTYSFEEREILITLINKHEDVEDKKSDPTSMCKRKSAWAKLAEEYNSAVGPHATRSAVQLRRCWENMKACKRNREEKRTSSTPKSLSHIFNERLRMSLANWQEGLNSGQNSLETSVSATTVGLPPNVVFEPKSSEPFTLQSVSSKASKPKGMKNSQGDFEGKEMMVDQNPCKQGNILSDFSGAKIELPPSIGPMGDCPEKFMTDQESSIDDNHSEREDTASGSDLNRVLSSKTNATQTIQSPQMFNNNLSNNSIYKVDELQVLALSEAQLKVDIAVMQKEEARVKLEEIRFRREEARLRMLFFTYKLDRLKED